MQVGLFTPDRSFIIANLDAQTIDLERFQYTQSNTTIFRVIDREYPFQEFKKIDELMEDERNKCEKYNSCTPEEIVELTPLMFQTSTALIYDAVMVLADALKQIGFNHLRFEEERGISCFDPKSTWSKGYTITNFMKNVSFIPI